MLVKGATVAFLGHCYHSSWKQNFIFVNTFLTKWPPDHYNILCLSQQYNSFAIWNFCNDMFIRIWIRAKCQRDLNLAGKIFSEIYLGEFQYAWRALQSSFREVINSRMVLADLQYNLLWKSNDAYPIQYGMSFASAKMRCHGNWFGRSEALHPNQCLMMKASHAATFSVAYCCKTFKWKLCC